VRAPAEVKPDPAVAGDDASRLDAAIRASGERLRALARPDGSFLYEYRVRDGEPIAGYNIVRHAGAIYALAMFEQVAPDPRTRETIARTTKFLLGAIRPLASPAETSAIYGMTAPGELADDAVLGATGLGLVALIAADALDPGAVSGDTLRALGNFLVFMQNPDGSFHSTYTVESGPSNRFDSLYYPGEAILALAQLAARDRDPRWHDAALRGIRYLATSRANGRDVPSDNWAVVATEELLRQGGLDAADRDLLARHAAQIAAVNTSTQNADPKSALFGCYTDDGRTTPSSTHLEGLLAAASILPRETLEPSIDAGIHFLLASMLPDGAMPADQRKRTVRIDYIQHALSAFIRYRAFEARK
jgi:hypothetical protein